MPIHVRRKATALRCTFLCPCLFSSCLSPSHFLVAADRALYEQLPPALKRALDEDADTVTLLDAATGEFISADAYVAAAAHGMSEAERQALHEGAQPPINKDPS